MAIGCKKEREFIEEVIGDGLLSKAIEWINNTLSPEDVFEEELLKEWAFDHGYIKEEN